MSVSIIQPCCNVQYSHFVKCGHRPIPALCSPTCVYTEKCSTAKLLVIFYNGYYFQIIGSGAGTFVLAPIASALLIQFSTGKVESGDGSLTPELTTIATSNTTIEGIHLLLSLTLWLTLWVNKVESFRVSSIRAI